MNPGRRPSGFRRGSKGLPPPGPRCPWGGRLPSRPRRASGGPKRSGLRPPSNRRLPSDAGRPSGRRRPSGARPCSVPRRASGRCCGSINFATSVTNDPVNSYPPGEVASPALTGSRAISRTECSGLSPRRNMRSRYVLFQSRCPRPPSTAAADEARNAARNAFMSDSSVRPWIRRTTRSGRNVYRRTSKCPARAASRNAFRTGETRPRSAKRGCV